MSIESYLGKMIPMFKVYNVTHTYIDQSPKKRKHAIDVLPYHHDELLFEFLRLQRDDLAEREIDLFNALYNADLFNALNNHDNINVGDLTDDVECELD